MALNKQQIKKEYAKKLLTVVKEEILDGEFDEMIAYFTDKKYWLQKNVESEFSEEEFSIISNDIMFLRTLDKKIFDMIWNK